MIKTPFLVLAAISLVSLDAFADGRRSAREDLETIFGRGAQMRVDDGTGVLRFWSLPPGARKAPPDGRPATELAREFLLRHGAAFGVDDTARQLRPVGERHDGIGGKRVAYVQEHEGVGVFAARLYVHFDSLGRLTGANGSVMPDFATDVRPRLKPEDARAIALRVVKKPGLRASEAELFGFRKGAARGRNDGDFLVYRVNVTDGAGYGEYLFIEAHVGKIIERHPSVHTDLDRSIFRGDLDTLVWSEGDPRGSFDPEIENVIDSTASVYQFFVNLSGGACLSYDCADAPMVTLYEPSAEFRGDTCPNAWWDGAADRMSLCVGVAGDETVAHEWGHAYTDFSHDLIYLAEPGALNEAYSDIWGETIDILNGLETDTPGGLRTDGRCSAYGRGKLIFNVSAPAGLVGEYAFGDAGFGPVITDVPLSGSLVLAEPIDACAPLTNGAAIAGNVALIRRGDCDFISKVNEAEVAGAIGAVVYNNAGEEIIRMGGDPPPDINIPSAFVQQSLGEAMAAEAPGTVVVSTTSAVADDSYRWLVGEDDPALHDDFYIGGIRDMWAPSCYLNPEARIDSLYWCGPEDGYGVHLNSGVANHAYALLVDGGTFNGETITGIGFNKAAQIYWHAQTQYQTPVTDYRDHADALEASCNDLVGAYVPDLITGTLMTEAVSDADCDQVAAVIRAVVMRSSVDTQCGFGRVLAPLPPPVCGNAPGEIFFDDFETDTGAWTIGRADTVPDFVERDWERVTQLPTGRTGTAWYAPDPWTDPCVDDTGVLTLTSPTIEIPAGIDPPILLVFEHSVATEQDYDGGDIVVRVDGGAWQTIDPADFLHNPYTGALSTDENMNPLAGLNAFHGVDGGKVESAWGQSQIDVTDYVQPGQTLEIMLRMSSDVCVGWDGWYVDDLRVVACDNCLDVSNPAQRDRDYDGFGDACDLCPDDYNKTDPGVCGCGLDDGDTTTDSDTDGTADCYDGCWQDAGKIEPGICGCGVADTDTDSDSTPDCIDDCDDDAAKTDPGLCGCGEADTDADSDGVPQCDDACDSDAGKTEAGQCGCGVADTDSDADGTADCNDNCPDDDGKTEPGECGCGKVDRDRDNDGTFDCEDLCPLDAAKTAPGECGCGEAEASCASSGGGGKDGGCAAAVGSPSLAALLLAFWRRRRKRV